MFDRHNHQSKWQIKSVIKAKKISEILSKNSNMSDVFRTNFAITKAIITPLFAIKFNINTNKSNVTKK